MKIDIAEQFTDTPGGRYRTDGKFSGQEFREDLLLPAFGSGASVTVNLEGVMGLPPSFLEEAFGGLVRAGLEPSEIAEKLTIVWKSARYARYNSLIWSFIDAASGHSRKRVG